MTDSLLETETPEAGPLRWPYWAFGVLVILFFVIIITWSYSPMLRAQTYQLIFLVGDEEMRGTSLLKLGGKDLEGESDVLVNCCMITIANQDEKLKYSAMRELYLVDEHPAIDIPLLIGELKTSDVVHKSQVIQVIGNQRRRSAVAVPALLRTLSDPIPNIRLHSIVALGKIGPESIPAVPKIVEILNDRSQDWSFRRSAAFALGGIGEDSLSPPALINALKNASPLTTDSIFFSLGLLGPKAASTVPSLINILNNKQSAQREKAVIALGKIGPGARSALPHLREAAKDPYLDRETVLFAIRLIDRKDPRD
ncbi:MAG: HEAT repeat domain-containing protein [Planctomycetota bacterium]|nr:HEAT repeat domain-containing protein [Planctomycetota bacterium]